MSENITIGEGKNTIWMPKAEAVLWQRLSSQLSEEQKRRTVYFFWNGFSMEGYDQYIKEQKDVNS